jgi:hypothetical protein
MCLCVCVSIQSQTPFPSSLSSTYLSQHCNNIHMHIAYGYFYIDSFCLGQNSPLYGIVYVNEVASSGTGGSCGTEDWIELINTNTTTAANLTGFILTDNNGINSGERFIFPLGYTINANSVRVVCGNKTAETGKFVFGINAVDTATLFDSNNLLVATTGPLPGGASATLTYQRTPSNTYVTASPTEGLPNTVGVGVPVPVPVSVPVSVSAPVPVPVPVAATNGTCLLYVLCAACPICV